MTRGEIQVRRRFRAQYGEHMRLTCPNCDAHYEVDASVIPDEGRDVQCSNCNTTWFQAGPDTEKEATSETTDTADDFERPEGDLSDDASAMAAAAQLAAARNQQPRRPQLKPEDLDVIEQEVARETAARKAETGALETQPDLGLDDTESLERAEAARDRIARRRGQDAVDGDQVTQEPTPADDIDEIKPAPRRDDPQTKSELLPDIEEINSTLKEAPEPGVDPEPTITPAMSAAKFRRGFRIGFGFALLIFAALIIAYLRGPSLAESFPSMAGVLEQYHHSIDELRVSLDGTAQTMVERINGMIGQVSK